MEILIGLAIATAVVIGWGAGNLFVCVFLSLGAIALAVAFSAVPAAGTIWLICVVSLIVIWFPVMIRSRA